MPKKATASSNFQTFLHCYPTPKFSQKPVKIYVSQAKRGGLKTALKFVRSRTNAVPRRKAGGYSLALCQELLK
jgi:hypothetical protein